MVWPSAINPHLSASLPVVTQGLCELSFGRRTSKCLTARSNFPQASSPRQAGTSMARFKRNQPLPNSDGAAPRFRGQTIPFSSTPNTQTQSASIPMKVEQPRRLCPASTSPETVFPPLTEEHHIPPIVILQLGCACLLCPLH